MLSAKNKAGITTLFRRTEALELRNTILRNIAELRQSQRVYMPGLTSILDDAHDNNTHKDLPKLWLPSEIPTKNRDAWCLPGVPFLEFRFRYAQADDSLAEIRRLRRLVQGLRDQNAKHSSTTQKNHTRSVGIFEGFTKKIQRSVERYSRARDAMLLLDPEEKLVPNWGMRFKKLHQSDVRGPGREQSDISEGKFKPSWIWLVPLLDHLPQFTTLPNHANTTPPAADGPADDEIATSTTSKKAAPTVSDQMAPAVGKNSTTPTINKATTPTVSNDSTSPPTADQTGMTKEVSDSMRAHWAKCQARADRYDEEVTLTIEEMGRTLLYLEWKQQRWISLAFERLESESPPPPDVQRGLNAYAQRQASIYETLVASFAARWRKTLISHGRNPSWLSNYPADVEPPSRPSRGHRKPEIEVVVNTATGKPAPTESGPPLLVPNQAPEMVDEALSSDEESDGEEDYRVDEAGMFDDGE